MSHDVIMKRRPGTGRTVSAAACLVVVVAALAALPAPGALAADRPALATAAPFAVLTGGGIVSGSATTVTGDVGVGPGRETQGLAPDRVRGSVHQGDATWSGAHGDFVRSFDALAAFPCERDLPPELGGLAVAAGTSCAAADARLSATLTLDAGGDADAVFVVRVPRSLTTAADSTIVLAGGARACNVFVIVGDSAVVGERTSLQGAVLAQGPIVLAADASVDGRILSRDGDIELDGTTVSVSMCDRPATTTTTVTPSAPISTPNSTVAGAPQQPGRSAGGGAAMPTPARGPGPDEPRAAGSPGSPPPKPPAAVGDPGRNLVAVPAGGGGDDTEVPSADAGRFPAELAARKNSVVRTGAKTTQPLIEALTPLVSSGVTAEQAVQQGFGRFPVGGRATYTHDWWFPRFGPGWRLHEGTDIFAAMGTPVRSPSDGRTRVSSGGLGGLAVYVVEPGGTYYYLAHLSAVAPGLVDGKEVVTGEVVGYVGDSGNARGGLPHLHFEVHPGGGEPVDPKPVLDGFLDDALGAVPELLRTLAVTPGAATSDPVTAGATDAGEASAMPPSANHEATLATAASSPGEPRARLLVWVTLLGLGALAARGFARWSLSSATAHHRTDRQAEPVTTAAVGDSGQVASASPHVHLELHPHEGEAVDPKPVHDGFLADALGAGPNVLRTVAVTPGAVSDAASANAGDGTSTAPPGNQEATGTTARGPGGVRVRLMVWATLLGLGGMAASELARWSVSSAKRRHRTGHPA